MKRKILLICFLVIMMSMPIYGKYEKIQLGLVEETNEVLIVGGYIYPIYTLQDHLYIPLSYFENMGCMVTKEGDVIQILNAHKACMDPSQINLKDQVATLSNEVIYVGHLKTYSIEANNQILVPVETVGLLWHIEKHQVAYQGEELFDSRLAAVTMDEEAIYNKSSEELYVKVNDIFWHNNVYEISERVLTIAPLSKISKWEGNLPEGYMTTVILAINGMDTGAESLDKFGQINETLFKRYESEKHRQYLTKLFPRCKVLGSFKYNVGEFKEKEQVEVWRAEKSYYYIVKDKQGKKVQVPCNSIHLDGLSGGASGKVTAKDIEDFVLLNEIKSDTNYLVWTDLCRQRTYVLYQDEAGWHLIKNLVCSSGRLDNPTPTGFFKVEYAMPYFGISRGFRCKNALVFYGEYMYHSILFDRTGNYIKSGQYELGRPVSHGCVRLSEADSEWLYKNIPIGSSVWIY